MANYNNPASKPMFAAYVAVRNALKNGEDYSKPLDVVWLCRKHYKEVHMLTGSRRESAAQDGATQPQQAIDGGTRDEQVREK
jgi:hypothetical protein